MADAHRKKLLNLCRFCAKTISKSARPKEKFKDDFDRYGVNIEEDNGVIHPPNVCQGCVRNFYRSRDTASSSSISRVPFTWEPHKEDSACLCSGSRTKAGRPSKKRKLHVVVSGSDTESGDDQTEDESEKESCNIFRSVLENIHLLDKELARVLCQSICSQFGLVFIDPADLFTSVRSIDRQMVLRLVETIFALEREELKAHNCNLSYKNIGELLKLNPETWLASRNVLLKSAVDGLSDSRTKLVKKVMAVDHMHSLVKPNFISPIMFGSNLVMYSIARSKMSVDIYGKLHPGGQYKVMKSWLNGLSMEIPALPKNDILTAIDNDQVLLKKWTVRKDNRTQISILTSVCCAEVGTKDVVLQQDEKLAPSKWPNRLAEAKIDTLKKQQLVEDCSATADDVMLLRKENKKMIHDILHKVVKEQTTADGSWTDDIDLRVADMRSKEGMRVCPVCNTSMPKTKRKCINQDCRVSLKSAEQEASGTDILGTALIAPVRSFQHRVHETSLGFQVQENKAFVFNKEEVWETHDEWTDVPSRHPASPIKVETYDPVFVNPNSFDSVKEVLRQVGHASSVSRYHPNVPDARKWLSVTMDGSPYLVSRKVIDTVYLCCDCEAEVLKADQDDHCFNVHRGRRVKFVKEFDWVLLRIGKLHLEMNMARTFTNHNWDVFMSELTKELGFTSEAAQKYVKKCSDHHKTMSILKVAHIGFWYELLVPYVRSRLTSGAPISVNDFLYDWVVQVGWKYPNYRYIFNTTWSYLMGIQLLHIGVRRNNAEYIRAGHMAFAPLFHRNCASKYALIDLHDSVDRASFPPELAKFVTNTESISTSGNPSKGECMDANLEEKNKESKVWQHGGMTALDWLRIFRNLGKLTSVRDWLLSLVGMRDPKEDAAISRRKYDFKEEVLAWRIKLRREGYLVGNQDQHVSLSGAVLDTGLLKMDESLKENRRQLLLQHFVEGKSRSDIPITTVYTTEEERIQGENINNASKAEILQRAEEKINLLSDEEAKGALHSKLYELKRKQSVLKKEILIAFFHEVCEELKQNVDTEEFLVFDNQDEDKDCTEQ